MADSYFQRIYTAEQSIEEVIRGCRVWMCLLHRKNTVVHAVRFVPECFA